MLTTSNAPTQLNALRVEVRHFLLQKEGCAFADCEDAIGINVEAGRFAVADGATEAFDAGNWAQRLAGSWVQAESTPLSKENFAAWVAAQGKLLHESWQGRTLTWYAEEKARRGSFAAFVGLQLQTRDGALTWNAVALGDSCLIQRRGDSIIHALPVAHHESFNSTPVLVPSHESMQASALAQVVVQAGTFAPGDLLLLLSDACAAWYLERLASKSGVCARFDSLLAAAQNDALVELLRDERRAGRIKDDDVAALRLSFA